MRRSEISFTNSFYRLPYIGAMAMAPEVLSGVMDKVSSFESKEQSLKLAHAKDTRSCNAHAHGVGA